MSSSDPWGDYTPPCDHGECFGGRCVYEHERKSTMAEWLLYEHDDGRHAAAPSAEAATFAKNDPAWHRVGPAELVTPSKNCPDCNGYGRINDGSGARSPYGPKCPGCGGTGRVPAFTGG